MVRLRRFHRRKSPAPRKGTETCWGTPPKRAVKHFIIRRLQITYRPRRNIGTYLHRAHIPWDASSIIHHQMREISGYPATTR
ncbi:hypothetical protein KCP78_16375 [Salmonella enterica subsp. enterica]|nr:hypothetical protein KCP78_16375 [Salmonella enterica subsp. enterica]